MQGGSSDDQEPGSTNVFRQCDPSPLFYNRVAFSAARGLTDQVYLTFDVDALDPSIMPATGTPEPEGLTYSECIEIVQLVANSGRRIVGIDVVEFAPIKKIHHASLTAARLVYKLLNIAFSHESISHSKRTTRPRRATRV